MSIQTDSVKTFFKTLAEEGAEPLSDPENHPYYVEILQAHRSRDPILKLRQRIRWSESESVSLLTGFRGNGKSTELNRLAALLRRDGCHVVQLDMEAYLLTTKPVEIGDFLLSLVAALSQSLEDSAGLETLARDYWERIRALLTSEVELDVEIDASPAKLGMRLSREPSFKELVQERLRGHTGSLVQQVHNFVRDTVASLRTGQPDLKVVILVDSVEHIRGVGSEREQVYESVVDTFSSHGEHLALPSVHLVYTVPPFLMLHAQSAATALGNDSIVMWPNIHVRDRQSGRDQQGLGVMKQLIDKRYPVWESLLPEAELIRLAEASGGDLRDFFRLIRSSLVTLGIALDLGEAVTHVDPDMVKQAIAELANERRMMLTEANLRRMARIRADKQLRPENADDIPVLTALLDANLVMNYQNGGPWYDVHPLIIADLPQ